MKLVYKPFGIVLSLAAAFVSKKLFEAVWGIFDKEEPPKPTTLEATWPKVLGAAVVQGVTFKVTRAAVDRAGAKGFDHLFGVWPGEVRPEKSQAAKAVR
jgi:pectin methylesterase-like acyl-CoA thioesterase